MKTHSCIQELERRIQFHLKWFGTEPSRLWLTVQEYQALCLEVGAMLRYGSSTAPAKAVNSFMGVAVECPELGLKDPST